MTHDRVRKQIVELARLLVDRGALSLSLHGNISVRLEDGERILVTGSSLSQLDSASLAVVTLDGTVLEGDVSPTEAEILPMHLEPYKARPDLQCLIHTHSPGASSFAVASRELPVVAESLARWDIVRPLPVAAWAPRGSEESVANIVELFAGDEHLAAVLLENHGILVGGSSPMQAARRVMAIEENALLALNAAALGGAKELSAADIADAARRKRTYETTGAVSASPPT